MYSPGLLHLLTLCERRCRKVFLCIDLQVAAERHSGDLRAVCVDVAALCLPDVLVRPYHIKSTPPVSAQFLSPWTDC